jgi:hypothetical protein
MGQFMSCHCLYLSVIEFIEDASGKDDPSVFGISTCGERVEAIVIKNSDPGRR